MSQRLTKTHTANVFDDTENLLERITRRDLIIYEADLCYKIFLKEV